MRSALGAACLLLASFGTVESAAGEPILRFPPFDPGTTTFTVRPDNATGLTIETLFIPKGHIIAVDPAVGDVVWEVHHLVFEENTTFDLSRPYVKPDGKPPVPPITSQSSTCTAGAFGGDGVGGAGGMAGHGLTLIGVETIENHGSLWIRTDGSPGGDGQGGGRGGVGGGPGRSMLIFKCGPDQGGIGGRGGPGGGGGATSAVLFKDRENRPGRPRTGVALRGGCQAMCEASHRPDGVTGAVGVLAISGNAGCGGQGGAGGGGGSGGLGHHNERAPDGTAGQPGPPGAPGACTELPSWH